MIGPHQSTGTRSKHIKMEGALAMKAGHTCPVGIGPLKIIHVADTHIGFAAYRKVCEDEGAYKGLNQREVDV